MASLFSFLNKLLPFASPGTPILQDLVHLGAICTLLYYAPEIQQWAQTRQNRPEALLQQPPEAADQVQDSPGEDINEELRNIPEAEVDAPVGVPFEGADQQHNHVEQPEANGNIQEGQPGPANPVASAGQRNVGAKKAKSLARRDQRRAYNEFQRAQGDAQRAQDAEGAAEREAALAAERERRKAVEAAVEAKRAKEREKKREAERKQREEEIRRRDLAVRLVKEELEDRRVCDLFRIAKQLGGDVDEEWVEKILRASGLLGMKDGVLTMVTSVGWAVRIKEEDMLEVYREAVDAGGPGKNEGIGYGQLCGMLERTLQRQSATGG